MNAASRAIAAVAGAFALIGAVAGPAAAKSNITVSAVPVSASAGSGGGDEIDVTAWGADDAGGLQRLCVDRQIGTSAWDELACAPISFAAGGTVHVEVPYGAPGPERFRARLVRVGSASGDAPVLDLVSTTALVNSDQNTAARIFPQSCTVVICV